LGQPFVSGAERAEVEAMFARWRAAVDARDVDAMLSMLTDDAQVGNVVFGLSQGKDAIREFFSRWPETVPNESVWHAIDGDRVVDKWRECLPGERADGSRYAYFGITESIYAGDGRWRFQLGLPDVTGLQRVYAKWRADGHAETYGELYAMPGG
jgi:uncharacterized protein (TIGR02246 family)